MIPGKPRTPPAPIPGRRLQTPRRLWVLAAAVGAMLAGAAGTATAETPSASSLVTAIQHVVGDPLGPISSDPTHTPSQPDSPIGHLLDPPVPSSDSPADIGSFTTPFSEPTIPTSGPAITSSEPCAPIDGVPNDPTYDGPRYTCKPAGVSVNVLPNGRVMYFDGLEGTPNVKYSIVAEFGRNAVNDQSRLLDLHGDPTGQAATWSAPTPSDGGANESGHGEYILPPALYDAPTYNGGALFCTDNIFLPDGRILANGGTNYYTEPAVHVGNGVFGVAELEGLKSSRIYDPATNSWKQTGSMHFGRWYPSTVTLPSGQVLAVSGVTKLLKPVYPSHLLDSATNVEETETYDPVTGRWAINPTLANKALPLYPRIHELPDGKVFYDAGGQSFNPFGQSYDEAAWNVASVYDPATQSWHDLGIPGLTDLSAGKALDLPNVISDTLNAVRQGGIPGGGNALTIPGFRGSTFSMELPLVPDPSGHYSRASFLTAGGVLNPPSPGSYLSTSDSRVTTIDTSGGQDRMSTHPTGDLPGPRWYPSGVLLPTGQAIAFNGSDRDAVVGPGVEIGKRQAELFDPATEQWTPLASSHNVRTYHNSAVLLGDGRVLVGGHAPISTLYTRNITLPGGITANNDGRDPSFEIYNPPICPTGPSRRSPRRRRATSRWATGGASRSQPTGRPARSTAWRL